MLRRRLWELSSLERVRKCGRVARTPDGGAVLRLSGDGDGRRAGVAGLVACGSPWACPCCAAKIGARRAQEIAEIVDAVQARGGSALLVTLTLRHNRGHSLSSLWDALSYGWSRVTSGKRYQQECATQGVEGWCRAVEVTYGTEHGFHPHAHVLVLMDVACSLERAQELAGAWHERFERAVTRRGYSSLAAHGGLDVRLVNPGDGGALGTYLSKIAHEVTGGMVKDGRRGNRSPFALLRDGIATGNADDLEAWWQFEKSSHRRRQLTWSQGVRDRYGVAPEEADETIAEQDMGGDDAIVLPAPTWREVRDHAEHLLTVAEQHGPHAAAAWLTARGLEWAWASTAPRRSRSSSSHTAPPGPCTTTHPRGPRS
jgi:hypothetical protein